MNNQEMIDKTINYVRNISKNNDTGHDFLHVKRVVKTALKIASYYPKSDLFLIEMVALLHDVEDLKLKKNNQNTSVKVFLNSIGLKNEIVNKIIELISFISYSNNKTININIPLEAKIVQDADRIDAMGAIGIARTFAYSAIINVPFYSKNNKSTLSHFQEKLFKLYDLLNTDIAKQIAQKRNDFLKLFYNEFLEEVEE